MPEPFAAFQGGCGGYVDAVDHCRAQPTAAGLRYYPSPQPEVMLGYACDEHRHELDAARPLTEADQAELDRRRENHRRCFAGQGPDEQPQPLAIGAAAKRLIGEARAHAAAHPEQYA